MEKEAFYGYVDSPESLNGEASQQLSGLIDRYPYFQGARVLYLKSLKVTGSAQFDDQLRRNAPLLANRRHLFFYLNAKGSHTLSPMPAADRPVDSPIYTEKPGDAETTFVLLDDEKPTEVEAPEERVAGITATATTTDADILEFDENGAVLTDDAGCEAEANEKGKVDLIEAFINSNPRIAPPKPVQGEIEDISLGSIAEPEEVASEPLAQIYLSQGLVDKAISIYEKLSLKYPEKSGYFAAQILKIKTKGQ